MKKFIVLMLLFVATIAQAKKVSVSHSAMVSNGIAKFEPKGYDIKKSPSLALDKELAEIGVLEKAWKLIPSFSNNKGACATLSVPADASLYGGGEVTGTLLRNGTKIKLWNTDTGAYSVDSGKRMYQSHPWIMGVRADGTSFGILFDTTWKATLSCQNNKIELQTEDGLPFRVFVIDRMTPQEVIKGLAELIGTMPMIPRWALGYHQCRFSYTPDTRVIEIADTMRMKQIPCDVIWMDIHYMDGFRIFTFNKKNFKTPEAVNRDLHLRGFHSTWMIDPGAMVDENYFVYKDGTKNDVWVKTNKGENYQGKAWPGLAAFPDFTSAKTRKWWSGLYKDFIATGVDGVWNDVNEPQIGDTETGTMPLDNMHAGDDQMPAGKHIQYHNVYGMLMVRATREGVLAARPDKRPFVLTRANHLGGQRYAATWTGDNAAWQSHLELSVPMSLTLGLSGQPISGADIGGFLFQTDAELFGHWIGLGAFYPFSRGHACEGTNNKEPWAFGLEVENASRIALNRRYILLPYYYTLMREAHENGMPIMRPLFFADATDTNLRAEQESFLIGDDLLVTPSFAKKIIEPKGIWQKLSLLSGDDGKYQATLKIRGGAIIPTGKIVQNTNEKSIDPLTLIVCLDENGEAKGNLYWDSGDGWDYLNGGYSKQYYEAKKLGDKVIVKLVKKDGTYDCGNNDCAVVKVITSEGVKLASGDLQKGIEVKL